MPEAKPAPDLKIPSSPHTVSVSIIDTTSYVSGIPVALFMQPEVPGYTTFSAPCYSFIIKHENAAAKSKYGTLLFDLGLRKDFENSPKAVLEHSGGFEWKVEKNTYDILKDQGDDPAKVGGIIWSHYHVDHTGDPSVFPPSTDLIVGPGFKKSFVPAYPTKPDSVVDEKAYEGRNLREIDFEAEGDGLMLGRYKALDLYGDGSFYLVDSPGHATGHMCALARTSADPPEFIVMGGDIAHHGGAFRPTEYLPLPETIDPNPLVAPFARVTSICPGAIFEAIHHNKSSTEPFMQPTGLIHDDAEQACESVAKWCEFDAQENIFAVIAHDTSLCDVVDFYPKPANEWKRKGWKEHSRWRFLRDFDTGSAAHKPT